MGRNRRNRNICYAIEPTTVRAVRWASIESSGAFPPDMTLEKLLGGHSSEPPNLIIANVLYKSELLESWGRGIKLIIDECRNGGIPDPEFHTDGSSVWVVFRYKREIAGQVPPKYPTSTPQVSDKYPTSTRQVLSSSSQ